MANPIRWLPLAYISLFLADIVPRKKQKNKTATCQIPLRSMKSIMISYAAILICQKQMYCRLVRNMENGV